MIDPARKHGDWAPDPFHSWAQPKRRRLFLGIAIQSCRINRKMLRGRMPAELYRQAHELVAELSSGGEEKAADAAAGESVLDCAARPKDRPLQK